MPEWFHRFRALAASMMRPRRSHHPSLGQPYLHDPDGAAWVRVTGLGDISPGAAAVVKLARSSAEWATPTTSRELAVIPLSQATVAGGLRVALVEAVIYQDRAKLHVAFETQGASEQSTGKPGLRRLDCSILDDEGSNCAVVASPWTTAPEGAVVFAVLPGYWNSDRHVTVVIQHIEDWAVDLINSGGGAPTRSFRGPWTFRFAIPKQT